MFVKDCKCGKKMIAVQTPQVMIDINTKERTYYYQWWCGGCGRHEPGDYSDVRAKEGDMQRWTRANS